MSKFSGQFCINLPDDSFITSVYTCILLEMITTIGTGIIDCTVSAVGQT